MIARRRPLHPLAVRYWLWRGQLVVNASPGCREAARYRALRDLTIALGGYLTGVITLVYVVGEQEQFWTQLRHVLYGK